MLTIPLSAQEISPTRIVGMEFPPLAISARVQGAFKIKCSVSPDGKVRSAEIVDTVSRPVRDILGKAAQDNVLQWAFSSIKADQSERSVVIFYRFELIVNHDPAGESRFVYESPGQVIVTAEISDRLLP